MNNYPPYGHCYGLPLQQASAENLPKYKNQNSKTHFAMGLAAGAAVAYLLT